MQFTFKFKRNSLQINNKWQQKQHETLEELFLGKFVANYDIQIFINEKSKQLSIGFI